MFYKTSSGNGRPAPIDFELEQFVSRPDYQILLDQARRIWDIHQHDLQIEGYRPPKKRSA